LSNSADSIGLANLEGVTLDFISYTDTWYRDNEIKQGGYSLERIALEAACLPQLNWVASKDVTGGTPGIENSVWNATVDQTPPNLRSYQLINNEVLRLTFDEPMAIETLVESNFLVDHSIEVTSISDLISGASSISLTFSQALIDGTIYYMSLSDQITDCAGNALESETISFGNGAKPQFNDLIITEIMADPEPVLNVLPNSEYIELYNATDHVIELGGLTLQDANNIATLNAGLILPHSYLILTANSSKQSFPINNIMGVTGWPSLANRGESLSLYLGDNQIFSVTYHTDWYKSEDKENGGWSLSMIDVTNPCGGLYNWTASVSAHGGTPGEANQVAVNNPDNFGPILISAFAKNEAEIKLTFNERLHPNIPYSLDVKPSINIESSNLIPPQYNSIEIKLKENLKVKEGYEIIVDALVDCKINVIDADKNSALIYLPEAAETSDIIINEILFNPKPAGVDFIEIYNKSDKTINLKDWVIGNAKEAMKIISRSNLILAPDSYLVLTSDNSLLIADYPSGARSTFFTMNSFPSFKDSEDSVLLFNNIGLPIDQTYYKEDYHFSLLDDLEGVSLERISFEAESFNRDSWKSAASTAGYATPGLINSQFQNFEKASAEVSVSPKSFIPDNSGYNDFATINYNVDQAGSFANVYIYASNGFKVRTLAEGALLSTTGYFTWDGTSDSANLSQVGYYIILFEIFDGNGQKSVIKETVALGARF
jgi:hypothetical protein